MTVFKPQANKIKITLTNIEVLHYFGSYERLFTMSKSIKMSIKTLLFDIALKENIKDFKNLKIDIKAKKNTGCVITLNLCKKAIENYYVFDFLNGENLTNGILLLHKNRTTKKINSSLYKMPDCFRLIVYSKFKSVFISLNEFCFRHSQNPIEKDYTEEYGKILIQNNAVQIYSKFFKDF